MPNDTININVPVLARVEGEGALDLTIKDKTITDLKLRIYEPPRYFEKFLEGRNHYDVPDTVARICGICPVAYQMSATHAIESIFEVQVTPWIRAMRRLFYCGEWLQSHSLHIHLLAAPDFLGFNSVIEMSAKYPDEVRRGLKLQTLGNDLIALLGARSVHPVGARIGGFSKAPDKKLVTELLHRVTDAKQDAIDLIHWLDQLDLPNDKQEFVSVALQHHNEYPFNEGHLVSDNGLGINISDFEKYFKETQVDHSTALHCLLEGKPYLVGPLARLNLNKNQLHDEVLGIMKGLNAQFPSKNMFHSIIARAIEIYNVVLEAENLLTNYQTTERPCMLVKPKAGTGYGCTEAPRGILWHRYDMDESGCVKKAVIIPPTSQNQPRIEQDLKNSLIHFGLDKTKEQIQLHAEKVIRNYDPCISCATHFLNLKLIRDDKIITDTTETKNTNRHLDKVKSFSTSDLTKTAIIGIGSPHDGDEAGWQMIEQLSENEKIKSLKQKGLTLFKLDRPGLALLDKIKPYDQVLIVDSIRTTNANTSYICIGPEELIPNQSQLSSHEIGVIESVNLLASLQHLPGKILIVGISDHKEENITKITGLFY